MALLVLGNCLFSTCSAGKEASLRLYPCEDPSTGLLLMESLTRKGGSCPPPKAVGKTRSKLLCFCVPGLPEAPRRQRAKSQALDILAGLSESTGHPLQIGETIQQQVLVKSWYWAELYAFPNVEVPRICEGNPI